MDKNIVKHFRLMNDPRTGNRKTHKLIDIMVIAITGIICGANKWTEIAEFGRCKKEWFSTFLELKHGIPSHDTFGRVFAILEPKELEKCFLSWIQEIQTKTDGEIIAIDGKTLRRSHDGSQKAIHMVGAWASYNGITLAQKKVDEKTNEIKAIPELLDVLAVKGCVVTTDAMGCQKDIAERIIEKEGDYVLALKGNQQTLHDDVKLRLDDLCDDHIEGTGYTSHKTVEKDHGRGETRKYFLTSDIDFLEQKPEWLDLTSIGMVESRRIIGDEISVERRYYITSLEEDKVKTFAESVRRHWGIENNLHWVLDVAFREDEQNMRIGHSAENAAVLRRIALNLLKQEKSCKRGIETKRKKAGWDHEYLLKVLFSG